MLLVDCLYNLILAHSGMDDRQRGDGCLIDQHERRIRFELSSPCKSIDQDLRPANDYTNGGVQGLVNIWWIPVANIIGRRFVFLATTIICCAAGVGLGSFHGVGSYMAIQILNGLGTAAYQAVIQLAVSYPRVYLVTRHDELTDLPARSSTCSSSMNEAECCLCTSLDSSSAPCKHCTLPSLQYQH